MAFRASVLTLVAMAALGCHRTKESEVAAPAPGAEAVVLSSAEDTVLALPSWAGGIGVRLVVPAGTVAPWTKVTLEPATEDAFPGVAARRVAPPVRVAFLNALMPHRSEAPTFGLSYVVFEAPREELLQLGLAGADPVGLVADHTAGTGYVELEAERFSVRSGLAGLYAVPVRHSSLVQLAVPVPGFSAPRISLQSTAASPDSQQGCDQLPPDIGAEITFQGATDASVTLSWGAATDETTEAAGLSYRVVKASAASAIDTIAEARSVESEQILLQWTAATTTLAITGQTNVLATYYAVLVKDKAGNVSLYAPARPTLPPTVAYADGVSADGSYQAGDVISLAVKFSGAVYVSGTPTLSLAIPSPKTAAYASGHGSDTLVFKYEVAAGDATTRLDYTGTDALQLAGGTIRNLAGQDASLALPSPGAAGSLAANAAIAINGVVAPRVTSVSSSAADGTYLSTEVIPIVVTFDAAVTVTGAPTLALATGGSGGTATYASGSGTTALVFHYTVKTGDQASDLDYAATTSLALASGTIKGAGGVDATLTLPSPGAAGSLGANKNLVLNNRAAAFSDGAGTNGINHDTSHSAAQASLATFGGTLYGAWCEDNGSAVNQVRVKRLVTGAWVSVDGGGAAGLNYDPAHGTSSVVLASYGNKLYAAWIETDPGTFVDELRVKSYDGTSWSDANGGAPLNYDTNASAWSTAMAVFSGKLYLAWPEERAGFGDTLHVKSFDGTTWAAVDGGTADGLNFTANDNAAEPVLAAMGNRLFAAWTEDVVRVKAFDGTSWTFVDGNGAGGLNYDAARPAFGPSLVANGSSLYMVWQEESATVDQIRARVYDGTSWSLVDGGGATGLNANASVGALRPHATVVDGSVLAFWGEDNGTALQLRAKKYGGGTWTAIDGGGANGFNKDPSKSISIGQSVASSSVAGPHLYVTWTEIGASVTQVRVLRY